MRLPLERDVVRYPLDRGSDAFHASGALLGFRHSVTAVVFDGASAVGSVSALFARARPHPGLVAALNESLPEVRHLVLRAAELDEQALGADKHAVAIAEGDGRLAAISETDETWLDDRRRARLEARLQTALAAGGPMELVLDGALVACEPEARGGRYIVTMRAAPRPRLPRDHVLTLSIAGHLAVPGATPQDWQDAGQCRDCFQPAFNYRPRSSAQYILAIRDFSDPAKPRGFQFGFILSYPQGNDYLPGADSYEPWHWRYVGVPTARLYREAGPIDKPQEFLAALPCYEERAAAGIFPNAGEQDVCLAESGVVSASTDSKDPETAKASTKAARKLNNARQGARTR